MGLVSRPIKASNSGSPVEQVAQPGELIGPAGDEDVKGLPRVDTGVDREGARMSELLIGVMAGLPRWR